MGRYSVQQQKEKEKGQEKIERSRTQTVQRADGRNEGAACPKAIRTTTCSAFCFCHDLVIKIVFVAISIHFASLISKAKAVFASDHMADPSNELTIKAKRPLPDGGVAEPPVKVQYKFSA